MTFNQILDKYRKISFSEKDKGDRFERLMQAYLKTDPKYAYLFKKVFFYKINNGITTETTKFFSNKRIKL